MVHKDLTYMSKNISFITIDNKTLDFIHRIKIENMMFAPFSPVNLLFSKKCLSFLLHGDKSFGYEEMEVDA